jgi:methylase of polypeptide subunit release factors
MTETPFGGIRLLMLPGFVMSPRPATEGLVDVTAERLGDRRVHVADVGTGSGAIAVALALRAPQARLWATVANLPYLSEALRDARPALAGEPPEAVFAPGDGLQPYRRLVEMCSRILHPDGALVF